MTETEKTNKVICWGCGETAHVHGDLKAPIGWGRTTNHIYCVRCVDRLCPKQEVR